MLHEETSLESSSLPSGPISPLPQSSHSSSPSMQPNKRRHEVDPGDEALISSLKEVTACAKEMKEKKATKDKGPNIHFGMEVAERLNRPEPRQQAIAKVRIQQFLLDVEYPSPVPDYPPPPSHYPIQQYPPSASHSSYCGTMLD